MKTRTRIALLFFVVTITVMLSLSLAVYYFSTQYAFTDFYKRLHTRAQLAARIHFAEEGDNLQYLDMRQNILEKLRDERDYFFEVPAGNDFKDLSESVGVPPAFFTTMLQGQTAEYRIGDRFFSGIKYRHDDKAYFVIVSAASYYYSHHLANLRKIFLVALLLTTVLLISISLIFSRHVFRPIQQITSQVRDINSQNLDLRLEKTGVTDEVNELKETFNSMLDRLEATFATQNNFISNASHELSTPLTAIMGEAEVALSKTRDAKEYQETLHIISNHAERLDRITKSLLFLAQTGFNGTKLKFKPVRIDQLLWNVKETIEQVNPKNQVRINMEPMPDNPDKLKILGIEQLLHLALTNVVNNACKYSGHKPVDISLKISNTHTVITVADSGIGIPANEMQFIYDPFFRASNTNEFEGFGIGLSLTRNIVRIHKGSIQIQSTQNEGTIVEIMFPTSLTKWAPKVRESVDTIH